MGGVALFRLCRNKGWNGKINGEGGALARFSKGKNLSFMVFHDFFANGESHAGSLVFGFAVEAFEEQKYFFGVFLFKAYSVVDKVYFVVNWVLEMQ